MLINSWVTQLGILQEPRPVAHWGDTDVVVLVVIECVWLFLYSVILAHMEVLLSLHNLSAAVLG